MEDLVVFQRSKKQVPKPNEASRLTLTSTRLCVQCETLFQKTTRCPVCGSMGIYLTYWVPTQKGAVARVQKKGGANECHTETNTWKTAKWIHKGG